MPVAFIDLAHPDAGALDGLDDGLERRLGDGARGGKGEGIAGKLRSAGQRLGVLHVVDEADRAEGHEHDEGPRVFGHRPLPSHPPFAGRRGEAQAGLLAMEQHRVERTEAPHPRDEAKQVPVLCARPIRRRILEQRPEQACIVRPRRRYLAGSARRQGGLP